MARNEQRTPMCKHGNWDPDDPQAFKESHKRRGVFIKLTFVSFAALGKGLFVSVFYIFRFLQRV